MILRSESIQYLVALNSAIEEDRVPKKYLTDTCPECGQQIGYFDNEEHIVISPPKKDNDVILAIACEGYWVVNPNEIGLPRTWWQDWTKLPEDINPEDFND